MRRIRGFNSFIKPPVGSVINWGHPLSRGLQGCWLFNETNGKAVRDLVTGNIDTFEANADTRFINSRYGRVLYSDANDGTGLGMRTKKTYKFSTRHSVVLAFYPNSSTNPYYEGIFGQPPGTGQGGTVVSSVSSENTPSIVYSKVSTIGSAMRVLFIAAGGGVASGAQSSTTVATDVELTVAGTVVTDSAIVDYGGTWKIYINGRFEATNNYNLADFAGTFSDAKLAFFDGTQWNSSSSMSLRYCYFFDRVLNPLEISSLYKFPYQFISTVRPHRFSNIITTPPATTGGIMSPRSTYWGDL